MNQGQSYNNFWKDNFEAQGPNVEWYTKVAAAAQNAIQCYRVIYDEKKKSYYPDITGLFSQEGR